MKKVTIILLILMISLFSISCLPGGNRTTIDRDHRIAQKQIEELLNAIESQDLKTWSR